MSPETIGRELFRIWEDQAAFNALIRQPPASPKEIAQQARDFVLYTEDELHELLRTLSWKSHRKGSTRANPAHTTDEAADVFKCFLSLMQILGFTPDTLFAAYWHKTAVVRQRYQEEWIRNVDGPCVVVDIDNVLCDYTVGICQWYARHPRCTVATRERMQAMILRRDWVNARTLGIEADEWQDLKHEFRSTGGKRQLPMHSDAPAFLQAMRGRGVQIVLLTSRPIDRYPNIYTDTLLWLQHHSLPFDFIWWGLDKAERVLEAGMRPHIQMVVDDDPRFVLQFASLGLPCVWLHRGITGAAVHTTPEQAPLVHPAFSLSEAVNIFDTVRKDTPCQTMPMPSTVPMPFTPERNPVSVSIGDRPA